MPIRVVGVPTSAKNENSCAVSRLVPVLRAKLLNQNDPVALVCEVVTPGFARAGSDCCSRRAALVVFGCCDCLAQLSYRPSGVVLPRPALQAFSASF